MFIDEMYEILLSGTNAKLTAAHIEICRKKLNEDDSLEEKIVKLKQIENGYQLFRKKHPEFREDSFRRFCFIRWSNGKSDVASAEKVFKVIGWKVKLRWLSE